MALPSIKKWCKVSKFTKIDLDSFTISHADDFESNLPYGKVFFRGEGFKRILLTPSYYLQCSEGIIGPFRDYEDVLSELKYRSDPLGNNYVPNRDWIILENPMFPSWRWTSIKNPNEL